MFPSKIVTAAVIGITSSNRGLGFEFARQYLSDGWQVLATCRDPTSARELKKLSKGADGQLAVFAMDVTDSDGIRKAATHFKEYPIAQRRRRMVYDRAAVEKTPVPSGDLFRSIGWW
jgi:NAD(P)-dependent dehydrogenase (short-subunit alcohol dehydrogenase family)